MERYFTLTSPLWGLALVVVCFSLAYIAARAIPFYRRETAKLAASRHGHLDGLRGFLAFGVVLTHMVSFQLWYIRGYWDWPPSKFYTVCGTTAVSLFFMITGFLFWKKAIDDGGGYMDWRALYSSRFRRLAPLYFFAVMIVFFYVGMRTGWTLHVDFWHLVVRAGSWLGLGILGRPDLNGMKYTWVTNTALWTLRYEWLFYIWLPVISAFARPQRFPIVALAILAVAWLVPNHEVVTNFVFGMMAAHLMTTRPHIRFLTTSWAALLALIGFGFIWMRTFDHYGLTQSVLLFPFFVCVVYGNSFFGLLSNLGARTMGIVSYSVYLMHCLLLYGVLYALEGRVDIAGLETWRYWALMFVLGPALVMIALCTYRWIEYPFMRSPRRKMGTGNSVPAAASLAR
jgi:peptidoglycan/LPS O-acetylase OafA/YrhL